MARAHARRRLAGGRRDRARAEPGRRQGRRGLDRHGHRRQVQPGPRARRRRGPAGRRPAGRRPAGRRRPARRRRAHEGRGPRGRALLRARASRSAPPPRWRTGCARRATGASGRARPRRAWATRRRRARPVRRAAGCSAPTSCSRCSTGRSARTAPCRGCSSSSTSPTSAPTCSASALCMDKVVFKDVMGRAGLPQVDYARGWGAGGRVASTALGFPCWVKPARLGSSVGIARVDEPAGSAAARRGRAARTTRGSIVEASAPGVEVECSVLGHADAPQASRARRDRARRRRGRLVRLRGQVRRRAGMELVVPARISATASRAGPRAGARGVPRSPAAAGWPAWTSSSTATSVLLNELNTMPGSHETSVFGKLWEADGLAYPELMDRLVGHRGRALRPRARAAPSDAELSGRAGSPAARRGCPPAAAS